MRPTITHPQNHRHCRAGRGILLAAVALTMAITCIASQTSASPAKDGGARKIVTKINGTVVDDLPVNEITVWKATALDRFAEKRVVPVENGHFSLEVEETAPIVYHLVPGRYNGNYRHYGDFFTEGGVLDIEIYNDSAYGNPGVRYIKEERITAIHHGLMKAIDNIPEYKIYLERADSLMSRNLWSSPEYLEAFETSQNATDEAQRKAAIEKMQTMIKEHRELTPAAQEVQKLGDLCGEIWDRMEIDFTRNDTTAAGLYKIVSNLRNSRAADHDLYIDAYETLYKDKFAGHPYVAEIDSLIPVYLEKMGTPGQHYVDVQALDADGNMRAVSEFIKGKVAVIDLWASWCGPCRYHSMDLIPIYEKYAPKGFEVIGIAREYDNDKAMRNAEKQDGYPWPTLAEINNIGRVWQKYGASTSSGRILLVDRNGIIKAVDPTPQELETMLEEML